MRFPVGRFFLHKIIQHSASVWPWISLFKPIAERVLTVWLIFPIIFSAIAWSLSPCGLQLIAIFSIGQSITLFYCLTTISVPIWSLYFLDRPPCFFRFMLPLWRDIFRYVRIALWDSQFGKMLSIYFDSFFPLPHIGLMAPKVGKQWLAKKVPLFCKNVTKGCQTRLKKAAFAFEKFCVFLQRALLLFAGLPLNSLLASTHTHLKEQSVKKLCLPLGYFANHKHTKFCEMGARISSSKTKLLMSWINVT